jgi:hypothetical protein
MRPITVIITLLVLLLFQLVESKQPEKKYPLKEDRYELPGIRYPLVLWPFLDRLDVPSVFEKKHYLTFLFKCVFFQGHCDLMGKWLKRKNFF